MTYAIDAHRNAVRAWHLKLAAAGPGWHDYAREAARGFVKEDPILHGDLLDAVQAEIAKQLPIRIPAPQRATTTTQRRT